MIKSKRIAIAIAAMGTLFSSAVLAQSTANMDVTATVTGTCKLGTVNALDFGNLDPTTAPLVTGKFTTITYLCTKGRSPASVTIGGAGNTSSYGGDMTHTTASGEKIPFSLSWSGAALPAGQGMGSGKEVSLRVDGEIAAGTYANVQAGDYKATLQVVFTP